MPGNLWVELDDEGRVQRASDHVRQQLEPVFGADLGLPAAVKARADLKAALGRKAGSVRLGLGAGSARSQYDVTIDQGMSGARCVLVEAGESDVGLILRTWAADCPDGLVIADADMHILWANDPFCRQVGYRADEVAGRSFGVFRSHQVSERTWRGMIAALFGTGRWAGNLEFRRSDGTDYPLRASLTAIRGPERHTTHYVAVLTDQTEQEELRLLDSVDASATLLQRMALGFAHDIGNLAGEIVGVAEQAMTSDDPGSGGSALERVEHLGLAAGEVSRQLRVLSGEASGEGPSDLCQVARDLGWLLVRASARTRKVEVHHGPDPIWVGARAEAMVRALLQPALRATIELPDERVLAVAASRQGPNGVLRLSYEADATARARLRMLFGEGGMTTFTGNVLRTRAMASGVHLSLELGAGLDATIAASAPIHEAPEPLASTAISPESRRWGTVLVVEDNEPLRELMVKALAPSFEATISASDGQAALDALERVHGMVDLVVMDLMMPRMRGVEFLASARERWPELRCIAVTGGASESVARGARDLGVRELLVKPFRMSALRQAAFAALADL